MSTFGTSWQKFILRILHLISPRAKLQFLVRQQLWHEQRLLKNLRKKIVPSWRQLRYLPRLLSSREKLVINRLGLLIIFCFLVLLFNWYLQFAKTVAAYGGEYSEGLIGVPRFVNPLLAPANDVDVDLSSLVFSGLLQYDQRLVLKPDLAASYEVSTDQKQYTFHLRPGVSWHNEQPFSADDVIFTFSLIQEPTVKSQLYRTFKGVTIEKIDDLTIRFILKEPYAPFLHTLTFGILPQHLWANVASGNLTLTELNLRPIGTGAWQFKNLTKDADGNIKTYTLVRNENYYQPKPHLQKIIFKFYNTFAEAVAALKNNSIKGVSFVPSEEKRDLKNYKNINLLELSLPQYTALFYNLKSESPVTDRVVREALTLAVDKEKIIREALGGDAQIINSPILPGSLGYNSDLTVLPFNLEQAANLLQKAGWVKQEDGGRKKNKQELQLTITTSDQSDSLKAAKIIQADWQTIGIKTNLVIVPSSRLQKDIIKTRAYETLILGEVVGPDPDPFAFWHSSQIEPPGLNLAAYANRQIDQLIEEARQTRDEAIRTKNYQKFQTIINQDLPATFLYSPLYTYAQNKQLKGVDIARLNIPADRFNNIVDWHLRTTKKLW